MECSPQPLVTSVTVRPEVLENKADLRTLPRPPPLIIQHHLLTMYLQVVGFLSGRIRVELNGRAFTQVFPELSHFPNAVIALK